MNNFSPNMLKTYQSCPKKYYFRYIENINAPQSAAPFEKGKKIHALANYKLQGINIDRLENTLNYEEQQVWNLLKSNEYYQKEGFKSEFALSAKLGSYWIGGRIDAVVHDVDNYFILDYKTGTAPKNAQYDFQTMVYLLCMDKYLKSYDTLSFVYIDLKNNLNHTIGFDENFRKDYTQRIIQTCNRIENDNVFECNTNNCKFCEYSKICQKS